VVARDSGGEELFVAGGDRSPLLGDGPLDNKLAATLVEVLSGALSDAGGRARRLHQCWKMSGGNCCPGHFSCL